jgi:hypothetical protein
MGQDVPNANLSTLLDELLKTSRDQRNKLAPRQPVIFQSLKKISDRLETLPQGILVPYGRHQFAR